MTVFLPKFGIYPVDLWWSILQFVGHKPFPLITECKFCEKTHIISLLRETCDNVANVCNSPLYKPQGRFNRRAWSKLFQPHRRFDRRACFVQHLPSLEKVLLPQLLSPGLRARLWALAWVSFGPKAMGWLSIGLNWGCILCFVFLHISSSNLLSRREPAAFFADRVWGELCTRNFCVFARQWCLSMFTIYKFVDGVGLRIFVCWASLACKRLRLSKTLCFKKL